MASCTYNCLMNVINIGNSIIGVSILAMPYCFRKCGILLSVFLIFISGLLTRLACYLLLKSAIMARRRNFEFLAFHTFGSTGKLAVEMSVIGFLIGVCIAFFVVIGDLGPPLAAEFLSIDNSPNLRTNVLMLVGLCVALPLGMLRKIDSLTSLSALSIAFYLCLILKIFAEAVPNLASNEWWYEVNWWKSDGLLPCLPIFSMALSCQTQLFEFFDTMNDPSLKRMQSVINGAVHLCSTVYIMVGTLGYIAFHDKAITGNILLFLTPSAITEIIKFGFILTVAVSFPLCLFPCRTSLHSLLFKQGFGHHDLNVTVIPENRFRILTISLIIITIGVAIMLPNIEFVLGIIGSTIGTLICLIFPAVIFIHDTSKNTTEKRMAQVLMGIGFFILIACTYSTLQETSTRPNPIEEQIKVIVRVTPEPPKIVSSLTPEIHSSIVAPLKEEVILLDKEKEKKELDSKIPDEQKRLEPPVPQEPEIKAEQNADLDPQALQKEDKEIQKDMNPPASNAAEVSKKDKDIDKQEKLLQKLEQQHKEQKLILEQQKKVLEELKLHKESHEAGDLLKKKVQQPEEADKDIVPPLQNHKARIVDGEEDNKLHPLPKPNQPVVVENKNQNIPAHHDEGKPNIAIKNVSEEIPSKNVLPIKVVDKNPSIKQENVVGTDQQRVARPIPVEVVYNVTAANLEQKTQILNKEKHFIPPENKNVFASKIPELMKKEIPELKENEKILEAHINKREPLEEKKDVYNIPMEDPSKNAKINDLLLGQAKPA
ncbi:Putative sodium-coupled neutral amino acid transporter 10 [Araneus ventricosus]|uniref:Sodium-coupled neutral amino acid transporter 10 n=1 Tax=Araneus ventricosus TaxID=182803 RepID=A0A4Y2M1W3_ARAVE|nr:Putative sodium-coupled neutral amino acid transporter 10 [Araneus ventricosus]